MKFITLRLACLLMVAAASSALASQSNVARELVVCGREEVFLLDLNTRDAAGTPAKTWSWQATGRTDLPPEYHSLFRSTDECKPVDGGRRILITSSGGAVALVERKTKAVVFYGRATNAHSADLLPNGRIAVAASVDPRGSTGDALILFDIASPGRELWRGELRAGHGIVWDEARGTLWALAHQEIRSYQLTDWASGHPRLTQTGVFPLPDGSGHDLYPVPGSAALSVTTAEHCWLFDRDRKRLVSHPTLGAQAAIKCIDQHPVTGQLAFVQADRPNWWSLRIQFLNPAESCSVPGKEFYKVRWMPVTRSDAP